MGVGHGMGSNPQDLVLTGRKRRLKCQRLCRGFKFPERTRRMLLQTEEIGERAGLKGHTWSFMVNAEEIHCVLYK